MNRRRFICGIAALISACMTALTALCAAPPATVPAPTTGASVAENVAVVLYVDAANPKASDNNRGTEDQPLKTIAQAAARAMENQKQNIGTKIVIGPGTYRECIRLGDGAIPCTIPSMGKTGAPTQPSTHPSTTRASATGPATRHLSATKPFPTVQPSANVGEPATNVSATQPQSPVNSAVAQTSPVMPNTRPASTMSATTQSATTRAAATSTTPATTAATAAASMPCTAPIIFEAREKGKTILSGSDIWGGWRKNENAGVWTHEWPAPWGPATNPWSAAGVEPKPIILRREMILLNGQNLRQVLRREDLVDGCFLIDDAARTVTLLAPKDVDVKNAIVEVARRPAALAAGRVDNIILRGLNFQHAAGHLNGAVDLRQCANVLIEDCSMDWSNWAGLWLDGCRNVTLRRFTASHNGAVGVEAGAINNAIWQEAETSYNNWRGFLGHFLSYASAGSRIVHSRNVSVRKFKADQNLAPGFWISGDIANIAIDNIDCEDNLVEGICIEGARDGITIANSFFSHNKGSGVHGHAADGVSIQHCQIVGNAVQLTIFGDCRNWSLQHCLMMSEGKNEKNPDWQADALKYIPSWMNLSDGSDQPLMHANQPASWNHFATTVSSDFNNWYHPVNPTPFLNKDSKWISFENWQKEGHDGSSTFNKPR